MCVCGGGGVYMFKVSRVSLLNGFCFIQLSVQFDSLNVIAELFCDGLGVQASLRCAVSLDKMFYNFPVLHFRHVMGLVGLSYGTCKTS